jgi:hypothetical protein
MPTDSEGSDGNLIASVRSAPNRTTPPQVGRPIGHGNGGTPWNSHLPRPAPLPPASAIPAGRVEVGNRSVPSPLG